MRLVNRVVAAVAAALLATAGVIAVYEIVRAAFREGGGIVDWPAWAAALARDPWSATGPTVFGVVLGLVGLGLLMMAARSGRPAWLAVAPVRADTPAFVSRRAAERALGAAAASVDGVTRARAHLGRRRVVITARVRPLAVPTAGEGARDAARAQLAAFSLAARPELRIRLRRGRPSRGHRVEVTPRPRTPVTPPPAEDGSGDA